MKKMSVYIHCDVVCQDVVKNLICALHSISFILLVKFSFNFVSFVSVKMKGVQINNFY